MNDRDGDTAAETRTSGAAPARRGGLRRAGLRRAGTLTGAILLAASASLGTLAIVQATPSGATLVSGLTASVQPAPAPTDSGAGRGTPTPTPTDSGKGKGTPSPTPTDTGKGKGTPTPTAAPAQGATGQTAQVAAATSKGSTSRPEPTSLDGARAFAGFRVRTLDGLAGAQLAGASISTITFDTAPGRPSRHEVELLYTLGRMRIDVVEVQDPLAPPASAQTYAEELGVGDSRYLLMPASGAVNAAETREADGVSIVVNFYDRTASGAVAGADRQTAHQVARQLG